MKFVSWNVNGIRACMNKGFNEYFDNMNADIFAIQETKMQEGQADIQKTNKTPMHRPFPAPVSAK